jgi:cytochrome c oxidase assembly protein subunit 11
MFFARNRPAGGWSATAEHARRGREILRKTECFCFTQVFAGADARELGLLFYVDRAIPAYLDRITLSYTMFVNQQVAAREQATGG